MPTLEGGDDAEEVEDNKLEGAGSEGEEDQGPRQAEDQAEAQQGQHMGPLLGVRPQPQDLHHHGGQHGRVEQEHQAEEAQVGDVADQGVPDPAPADRGGGAVLRERRLRARGLAQGATEALLSTPSAPFSVPCAPPLQSKERPGNHFYFDDHPVSDSNACFLFVVDRIVFRNVFKLPC